MKEVFQGAKKYKLLKWEGFKIFTKLITSLVENYIS
jgi:hypothetical protein